MKPYCMSPTNAGPDHFETMSWSLRFNVSGRQGYEADKVWLQLPRKAIVVASCSGAADMRRAARVMRDQFAEP